METIERIRAAIRENPNQMTMLLASTKTGSHDGRGHEGVGAWTRPFEETGLHATGQDQRLIPEKAEWDAADARCIHQATDALGNALHQ